MDAGRGLAVGLPLRSSEFSRLRQTKERKKSVLGLERREVARLCHAGRRKVHSAHATQPEGGEEPSPHHLKKWRDVQPAFDTEK